MRAEPNPESPNSDETPSQKQDPLERRRLQNRLSQRNHRRKIRDRIAKLQERVIANELRAAAALNGWDQVYAPSPLVSPRHGSHQDAHFISSRDPSPLGTEPSTPFMPPYAVPSTPSWSSDWPVSPYPGIVSGDSTVLMDGALMGDTMCAAPYISNVHPVGFPSTSGNGLEGEEMHDLFGGGCLSSNLSPSPTNQPSYYLATETALPQVLQALNTVSPQSKIIVLVPDAMSTTASQITAHGFLGSNGPDQMSPTQTDLSNTTCHCQAQNGHSISSTQMFSRSWQTPGYMPGCQPHKQTSMGGSFPAMTT